MNLSNYAYQKIEQSWWILRITYGLLYIIAGLDKFLNLVTYWQKYLSPMIVKFLPASIPASKFMLGVGIVEIIIGILVLTAFTRIGAYLVMAWFLIIVINLLSMGTYFDIAVRDLVMAVGAFVLAQLTDVHDEIHED